MKKKDMTEENWESTSFCGQRSFVRMLNSFLVPNQICSVLRFCRESVAVAVESDLYSTVRLFLRCCALVVAIARFVIIYLRSNIIGI